MMKSFEAHGDWVVCMVMCGKYLVSGGADKLSKVWDPENEYTLVKPLYGHTRSVTALATVEGKLISGSADATFRVWNPDDDWNCIACVTAHRGAISVALEVCGFLVTGSTDNLLKVSAARKHAKRVLFKFFTVTVLEGVDCETRCDVGAQVWNPKDNWRYKKGGTLEYHNDSVSCATVIGPYMLTGSHDKSVCVRSLLFWRSRSSGSFASVSFAVVLFALCSVGARCIQSPPPVTAESILQRF